MLSPIGVVVGVALTQRLLTFRQDVVHLANSGPRAEDFLSKPKGFFGKRRYRKKLKKKNEELEERKQNVYSWYYVTVGLVLVCSSFGGYSVMIPVAMIIATALNKELFSSSIPIIGQDQTKYVKIWNRYVQSEVHLLLGADGEYDQKLMKKYNRRKSFFLYRWLTKETKALKNLEKSLDTDSDVVMDFIKSFFISFLKFTILLAPIDLLVRLLLGEHSSLVPQVTWSVEDIYLNGIFCCLGMTGAIAGLNLMKIAISANPKVKLVQNQQTRTGLPPPPMMPKTHLQPPLMRSPNTAPPPPMIPQVNPNHPPPVMRPPNTAPPPPMIPQVNPNHPPPVMRPPNTAPPPPMIPQVNPNHPPPVMRPPNTAPPPPMIPQVNPNHPPPVMRPPNTAPPPPRIPQVNPNHPPPVMRPPNTAPPPPMIPQVNPNHPPPVMRPPNTATPPPSIQPAINTPNLPIPPGGLPPGWTIQHWNHHGAQWLRNQQK